MAGAGEVCYCRWLDGRWDVYDGEGGIQSRGVEDGG